MTAAPDTAAARDDLTAECDDVHYTLDDLSVWCTMVHPTLGTVSMAGRTEEIAFRRASDALLARKAEMAALARRATGEVPAVAPDCYDHTEE